MVYVCHVTGCEMVRVCQVTHVLVTVLSSPTQRSHCLPVTANVLLYIAELCASVKLHAIPLLPLIMPAIINITTDLSVLTRSVILLAFQKPDHVVMIASCFLTCVTCDMLTCNKYM